MILQLSCIRSSQKLYMVFNAQNALAVFNLKKAGIVLKSKLLSSYLGNLVKEFSSGFRHPTWEC